MIGVSPSTPLDDTHYIVFEGGACVLESALTDLSFLLTEKSLGNVTDSSRLIASSLQKGAEDLAVLGSQTVSNQQNLY